VTAPVPLLDVEDLEVHFPSGNRGETVKAVDGVTLSLAPGETLGIIGESGSGKSTLGRAMAGFLKPTRGLVRHLGVDAAAMRPGEFARHRRAFQMVFQDPNAALDPRMTIGQSVREPLDIVNVETRAQRERRVLDLLDRVGLGPEFALRYPHELSGGQKQRANIGRALALDPKVLVCDEVVAALDVSIQADILNLFVRLQAELGLAYVFITHDLGVAAHIADRIAVMYLGKVVELGPAGDIMHDPLHPYTKALLSSEPVPVPRALRPETRIVLMGEIPSPVSPPSGCRFRTRCWLAAERCAEEAPAWRRYGRDHWNACHFTDVAEASDRDRFAVRLPTR
jgi:oligopeptide/dipeptide ABC transporter ATP-binding protein